MTRKASNLNDFHDPLRQQRGVLVDALWQGLPEIGAGIFHEKWTHDIWSGFPGEMSRQLLDQRVLGSFERAGGSCQLAAIDRRPRSAVYWQSVRTLLNLEWIN